MGKQTRETTLRKSNSRCTQILELIHADICGPLPVPSIAGNKYFLLLVDNFSRKIWIYFLKYKSQAHEKFSDFKNMIKKQTGQQIKTLRTDRGGVFLSTAFSAFTTAHGIDGQLTQDHTPHQKRVVERRNRSILDKVRTMLILGHIPASLWPKAAKTSVYILNRTLKLTNPVFLLRKDSRVSDPPCLISNFLVHFPTYISDLIPETSWIQDLSQAAWLGTTTVKFTNM